MPDIQFFDASGFFTQKITELEQILIAKKAELEILLANRRNLEQAIGSISVLESEQQQAIQVELNSLKEVLHTTERTIGSMTGETDLLGRKLAALQTARSLMTVPESR